MRLSSGTSCALSWQDWLCHVNMMGWITCKYCTQKDDIDTMDTRLVLTICYSNVRISFSGWSWHSSGPSVWHEEDDAAELRSLPVLLITITITFSNTSFFPLISLSISLWVSSVNWPNKTIFEGLLIYCIIFIECFRNEIKLST